jgi:hypothetical protein
MSKKGQVWKFRIINSSNFIAFLRKLKLVDKSVPLEIEGDEFFGKVRTVDKSVVKYVSVKIKDVFEGDLPQQRIKIGIQDIGKLIDAFKYFGPEEELYFDVTAQPYDNSIVATEIKFYSSSLNIFIRCADISLLSYIDDEIQRGIHSTDGSVADFKLGRETFQKLSQLTSMETNSEELLNLDLHEDGLTVRGNSFQYHPIKGGPVNGFNSPSVYSIYKNQFTVIDQENSLFYIQDNRIIVISEESNSKIAIGLVEC